jgi:membrane protein DedA with SNARE-associated domain
LRVPLTVAAGILMLPYRVFAISVAVSSSAWAAIFLLLGSVFGDGVEHTIRARPALYGTVVVATFAAVIGIVALRHLLAGRRER